MSIARRVIFPFGIFFLLYFILSVIAAGGIGTYFYLKLKDEIKRSESDARNYVAPFVDACAQLASVCDDKKVTEKLNPLFQDYGRKGIVSKAFFVKDDGFILAHSNPKEVETLKNNIAADEFTYNIDQIFLMLKKGSGELYFGDYYLIDRTLPFDKRLIAYMKKYFDPNIDRNGWLISKAVFTAKNKPYGVAAFFIDKTPIYETVKKSIDESIRYGKYATAGAAGIALFISLLIFIRYMMIARGASGTTMRPAADYTAEQTQWESAPNIKEDDALFVKATPVYAGKNTGKVPAGSNTRILDAIPLKKRKDR
jgi:hypothetical protein